MKKISGFFLAFLVLCISTYAQNTTIKGLAPRAEGKSIRIITYSDQISYLEKTIAITTIDTGGKFFFDLNIQNTIFAYLDIDFQKADFYLEPEKNYEIKIDTLNFLNEQYNSFINPQYLNVQIINTNKNELNLLIQKFNVQYNDFIIEKFNNIYRSRNKSLIDTLKIKINDSFSGIKNNYFNNYIKYKIASLEQMSRTINKSSLAQKYFIGKPILYNNVEYMYFFNEYFSQYLTITSKPIKKNDLISTINLQNSYPALLDSLGKDTLLRNEVLRELVLLKGLSELFYSPDYNRKNILKILNDIAFSSKFEEHRLIAKNLIITLTKLQPGTPAPDFTFININNDSVSLSNFKGKYIYLNFWTTKCTPCLQEMELMNSLNKKYKDDIEFVSISLDKEFMTMYHFFDNHNFIWTFLHSYNNYEITEAFDVEAFPLFVLLDKEGNILKYPAPGPSENIEMVFEKIID
ncbi:MAG: TlpA family protein disulfide reductase [Bacteroidales bacterium]|nr:TlpA family protein disulfide reductase [Bacteroidales bacterium]